MSMRTKIFNSRQNECIIDYTETSTGATQGASNSELSPIAAMPDTLRLTDGGYMRRPDLNVILDYLYQLHCVEVVGFSNIGKSALLRLLAQPDVWIQELGEAARDFLPVYIDCNSMLAMNDHGFYELILRALKESLAELAGLAELNAAYETMVSPPSEFQVPLSFSRGLNAVLQATPYKLILLLDEFDEPFAQIDSRVFINLRAFKDRHNRRLAYVTATGQPLVQSRLEDHCGEFCELFTHHTWRLAPLTRSDVERFVHRYVTAFDAHFLSADIDFIYAWAGGHPRLLNGLCRILEEALEVVGAEYNEPTERWRLHEQVVQMLRHDESLLLECEKLWSRLSEAEQMALGALSHGETTSHEHVLIGLLRQHLLLKMEGRYQPFSLLFADFVQRRVARTTAPTGRLWLDQERGVVLVNGQPVDALTNLEYRLLSLLFAQRDKIIDKYQIVANVWGESFIDEVDDARIEKLVSRVRQKIEADPSAPHFLTTVRGRGYKLVVQ
jgi:DNA-binding winged helix-turn-helix (wHTH) protein